MLTRTCSFLCCLFVCSSISANTATPHYAEALKQSILFYDAQRSGILPDNNRIPWRGDSALDDGFSEGVDLVGGWYDAGDHVKFSFPMAAATTMLAWSVVEHRQAYEDAGQLSDILNNIKWATDYFVKAHTAPNELWGQVGTGWLDHSWWGPAEEMRMQRPAYKIDETCPGTDLAASTAAAMAASAIAFKETQPAYADNLVQHARELYQFADNFRGKYSDCIIDAVLYYNSWSGYQDELIWGAIWLYRATGELSYLNKARSEYELLNGRGDQSTAPYRWTHNWDNKIFGAYVLMAQLTGELRYQQDAERWLDYWTDGYQGERVTYTPGGLAWLDRWGALRYSANTAMVALVYADYLNRSEIKSTKAQRYQTFAKRQIDYMLGDNPAQRSFVVGFGKNPPRNPHHRSAHASWLNSINIPENNTYTLFGALVGGPDQNDSYQDNRQNYIRNEVAVDYNSGFTGALARLSLLDKFAPNPDPIEPPIQIPPTVPEQAKQARCEVQYKIANRWGTGFIANVSIKNTGELAIEDWRLDTVFTRGEEIVNAWNMSPSPQGNGIGFVNAGWNSTIAPGAQINFGFEGRHNGNIAIPSSFSIAELACSVTSFNI